MRVTIVVLAGLMGVTGCEREVPVVEPDGPTAAAGGEAGGAAGGAMLAGGAAGGQAGGDAAGGTPGGGTSGGSTSGGGTAGGTASCQPGVDPCAGVTCSGLGRCVATGCVATCACNAGAVPNGLDCVSCNTTLTPPRLLTPSAGAIVSSHRPTVRWANAAGQTGATLQFCADRVCTQPLQAVTVTMGAQARPASPLPPGPVFVRAAAIGSGSGCFAPVSPAWPLRLGALDKPIDSWIPGPHDGNGDGWPDQLITSDPANDRSEPVLELQGGPRGLASLAVNTVTAPGALCQGAFGRLALRAGDINGDGFGDAVLTCIRPGGGFRSMVFPGSATGLRSTPLGTARDNWVPVAAADFDADGYGDVVFREGSVQRNALLVLKGGPTGLAAQPSTVMDALVHGNVFGEAVVVLDFDGDGRLDLVAGSIEGPRFFLAGPGGLPAVATGLIPAQYFGVDAMLTPDLDGDGRFDLLAPRTRFTTNIAFAWTWDAASNAPRSILSFSTFDGFVSTVAANTPTVDLNADGQDDVILASAAPRLNWFLTDRTSRGALALGSAPGGDGWLPAAGGNLCDLDGDERPELIAHAPDAGRLGPTLPIYRGRDAGFEPTPFIFTCVGQSACDAR